MQEHSRFEELCALAGVGQISADELSELNAHLQECGFCRELQSDFIGINSLWLSQAQKPEPEVYDPQSALRQKVLRNLQASGAHFSRPLRTEIAERPERIRRFVALTSHAPVWAAAALVVVASVVGFQAGAYRHSSQIHTDEVAVVKPAVVVPPQPAVAQVSPQKPSEQPTDAQLQLQQKLADSETQRNAILAQMKTLQQRINDLQSSNSQNAVRLAQLTTASEQDHSAALSAQAELKTLTASRTALANDLVAAQYQMRELEQKLADQAIAVDRERTLAAMAQSSEMRDVIGSRNLHIVDVADVTNSGVRRPFGRIFYTEGKSLIIYAYDLSGAKGKQAFYAWGHREGDPSTLHALGVLQNDDPAQARWVFKCSNTKVLAQIDSVYVTLEPTDKPGNQPRGKKLLNAYLGTPANHP